MRRRRANATMTMTKQLDEHDPLFAEWSDGWRPAETHFAPQSLAPHEVPVDGAHDERLYPPVSAEHREKLQRYVKATVAGCVVLCLAAIVRVGVSHVTASESNETRPVVAAAPSPEPARPPVAVSPAPPPVVGAARVQASAPVVAPAPIAPAAPVAPSLVDAIPAKTAAQERESARHALERGKLRDAVAAGERATALDPADAEAWLILGAAHQELGHGGAARTAFLSCVKSARRGPVRECGAMLR
jgi:hypothetical protein